MPGEASRRQLAGGAEDGERDREVEAGPLFAQVGWRQVDGDPPDGPFELGGGDATAHAVLRLLAGAVGEADDREARHTSLQVRLDFDAARLEADESVRDGAREHVVRVD